MPNESASNLKDRLRTLHDNLSGTAEVDEELRGLLTQLDGDIHALLARREAGLPVVQSEPAGLAERTQEISARFAARHPKLEPALRELGNMLSSMGI